MDRRYEFCGLSQHDAMTLAAIYVNRGCRVTIELQAEGLVQVYYKVIVDAEGSGISEVAG